MVLKLVEMKKFVFALSATLLFSCSTKKSEESNQQTGDKKLVNGLELYLTNCALCHGSDGKKGVGGAKDLSVSTLSHEQAVNIITLGSPKGMTPYKDVLSTDEIDAVATYIETLRNK
jgi:cytochrome c6